MLTVDQIPDLVKHVTMAIMGKSPPAYAVKNAVVAMVVGKNNEHFMQCLVMAVNSLVKQDHLALGSSVGPGGRLVLTGRGMIHNRQHGLEGSGKSIRFDQFYTSAVASINQPKAVVVSQTQMEASTRSAQRTARSVGGHVRGSLTKTALSRPNPKPEQQKPKSLGTSARAKVALAKRAVVRPTAKAPTAKKPVSKRTPVRKPSGRV